MNPTLKKIKEIVVDPEIRNLRNTTLGFVTAVYYENRTCDVTFVDRDNSKRTKLGLPFPKDGDGVFTQTLEAGDKVELAFRNQTKNSMYISTVYKRQKRQSDLFLKDGQDLPLSTDLF